MVESISADATNPASRFGVAFAVVYVVAGVIFTTV
jgi:hypothetical protein